MLSEFDWNYMLNNNVILLNVKLLFFAKYAEVALFMTYHSICVILCRNLP